MDFDHNRVNRWSEGNNYQDLKVGTRRRILKLNRLPVYLEGKQINVVDTIHSIIVDLSLYPKNLIPKKVSVKTELKNVITLKNIFCILYIMLLHT